MDGSTKSLTSNERFDSAIIAEHRTYGLNLQPAPPEQPGTALHPSDLPNGPARWPGWCDAMRREHHRCYQGLFTRLASLARSLTTPASAGLLLALAALLVITPAQGNAQSATYRVTFQGTWTTTVTPGGVPSGAHFTTLIGAVHNDSVTFWSSGGTASAGVKAVAELGTTGAFKSEINANTNAVAVIEKSLPSGGTPTATVDFTVTTAHPRVTLLTMVAPSPDWFVGVSGLSLLDAQGDWLALHTVDLFPYDAGTEEGTEFSLSNTATSPQGTITSIKGTGKFSDEPIATLTFTLQAVAPELILAAPPAAIVEAGGSAMVTVEITNGVTFAKDKEIALSFAGTATKSTDYTVALESLTLTAGQSSVATTVTALQDRVDDDAETILITASHGGGTIGAEQTITIIDDDAAPAVTTCSGGMAGTYPCSNVDLMSFLALADIGGGDANDIWGWTDSSTSKEYAIMGRTNGTSFVDISDPVNPIYLGNLPPPAGEADERDIKVYADHAFIVTEANDSGMQVFDLTQLRAVASPPATFSETTHYSGFSNAHNLAVNEDSGFAYAVGTNTCGGGLNMIDIQTPTNRTSAGCFSADGYTHDAQCVNYDGPDLDHQGKEICFNSNLDTLTIVDVTNKADPVMLSRTGYSGSRYTHQGWLTEDQGYFLLDDELDEANNPDVTNTRTYMWNVSDLDGPALIGFHDSTTTAIDHNQYVKGSYTYQSNYRAGLRILDITDIANGNLSEEAFFDVDPGSDSSNYDDGAWSNYPFFDSGIVIVSVIEQGLFILRPNLVDGVNPALASAAVNGAALTLTYGEALDESSTPATDAFTVTVAGSGRTVTHVSVSGRVVTLTLASAVTDGQEVTVTYTVPGTNPLRDAAGNAAEGLSNDPVWNATPDATPPTISIVLSPGHGVPLNMAITATVTLDNLDPASYSSLVFRADLTEWKQAFARSTHCEGKDTGKDITVEVDASRETITVEVWKSCSQDIYAYFTLDAALFRLDTSAPGGRVELASAETRFAMSRYLQAGQTAPPPPAPGVAAWLDPDPTSFEWKVGESVVFRGRTDILQYLNHHLGVRGFGPEDGARFADDTDGLDAEEACRNVDDGIVDWRRAIHQPVRFFACRAGEAIIEVWHETEAERLSTYEFRVRPADDDEVAAPVITTTSPILVPENETAVATLNATDQDSAAADLAWSKAGGADAGQFMLSADGDLAFAAAPDYENPDDADGDQTYEVTVQVSDGDNTDTADILVTLQNVLELFTELEGPSSTDYAENGAVRVAAYTASSEADRDGVAWSLGGDDAEHFSIDNPAGVLRFHIDPDDDNSFPKLPDYEAPVDDDGDNVYEVIVRAQAGTALTLKSVIVTVTDENEAGAISLDTARPKAAAELMATLTDPDGVTAGTVTWQWERSTGPNAWKVIAGATAASYTPTAADTGAYLRATAAYTDSHPADQSARAVSAEVVTAHTLSRLEVTTSSSRSMYPVFDPEILHYAVGCQDTLTLTLSTRETDTRLAVNGIQRANQNVAVELTGLAGGSDIPITLTGSEGASTTYVLHCLADDFPAIITEKKPGAWDGLITIGVPTFSPASPASYLAMIDNNGVPRIHWRIFARVRIFRTHRDGRYPYSYGKQVLTRNVIVLDENLEPVDTVTTVPPLHDTDLHDFVIKSNGNYLLLAYEPARRDLSQFTNSDGNPYSTTEDTRDSVIQEVTPDKEEAFNWNSWDHMAVEDCTQHRFPDDYAHVNSVQAFDDDIVASFRGCSKVLRIDGDSGDVIWRLGKSNRSDADWTASGIQPPLRIVGDPYGEFCGQHSARMIGNGNLLLFDNGVACLVDPKGNRTRPGEDFSRVVEYAIDPDHGEAIFQRHYSYHGEFNKLAQTQGHIELLETGNWLISWGSMPVNEQVTEFNPLTGEEVLIIKLHVLGDSDRGLRTTAYPVEFVALAKKVAPLTAEIIESPASSLFHLGPSDAPKVAVAFSRPVVDFAADTTSVSLTGATIAGISPHVAPGDPANAYLFTLTPTGVGPITFALVAGQPCASDGICTADETVLTEVPASHVIPARSTGPPVMSITSSATHPAKDAFTVTITFSEPVTGLTANEIEVTKGTASNFAGSGAVYTLEIQPNAGIEDDVTVTVTPGAVVDGLNNGSLQASAAFSVDTKAPVVSTIEITSRPQTDATYAPGDAMEVTVTFSETVAVTGMPRLTLNVGGGNRTANYRSGADATLLFSYTVADGESDADGVSIEADSLSRNGGTIQDAADNDAVLDHEALAADSSHKVDGVKPELAVTGGAVVDGATLTLTWNEPLDGSSTPETDDFTVAGGDHVRTVTGVRVNGSAVELRLDSGAEHEEAGIQLSYTPGMNRLRDVAGNEAEGLSRRSVTNETPDTTAPLVSSLAIGSNPGSDQTYAAEDEIEVRVTFNETVEVEGTPQLRLRVGSRTRTAGYESGTGTAALVFAYEVADGDEDTDGVSVNAGRISLNGGTIKDEGDNPAELAHEAVAAQAGHQVDGVRPSFLSAAVDGSSLTLTYGEALDGGSRPAAVDFTVEVDGSGRSVTGVSLSGSEVTLFLNPAVEHQDTGIRVSYTVPTEVGANPIQDEVGNEARGLSNRSVTNTTGALNTAPEISSPSSFDVPENQSMARRLAARDTDPGDEVTGWAVVGGADRFQFSIAPDTGELSFREAPDYESPADAASADPLNEAGDNAYVVTVEVTSGAGARELTAEQTFTIRVSDEPEPPEVPEAPAISGETADSLEVSWSEPDNTGPPITGYDVQYREEGRGRFTDAQHEGPGLTLTLTDLEPGTVYEVQVRAKNDEGTGDWSDPGEGMTVTPLTVGMASGADPPVSGPFTVRFSFSEPVTGFSRSDVETGQDPACRDDQNNTVFCDAGIGTLQTTDDRVFTATVTPWTDRVAHSYTLRLTVPGGAVRSSVGSKPNEEPEEPLEVRVAPPGVTEPISSLGLTASGGNGSVRLSWNRPSDDGGSPIIRYEYRYQAVGEPWSEWENVGAGTRSVTVGNLVNGREYVFEVRAVSALGKGGAETVMAVPELRIAPPRPPPAPRPPGNGDGGGLLFPPEAPAGLMAMPGEGAVRLEWSPPESDGGTPILRYEYRLKEGLGEFGEWTPIEDSGAGEVNAAGYTVGELGKGTVYVFELRAVNLVGDGRVSEAVEVVMGLDRAYWSNFGAEDLEGGEASLEHTPFGGTPRSLRLRFGAGLRFEESELDGEGEVTGTRSGSYGYRYTSRTTGELRLDYDGGDSCELRMTFRGVGAGSYSYRCGGALRGQGSFRLSGLNRGPEITGAGAYEVAENTTRVGRVEAMDSDEGDEIEGYGIAGGADGGLFAVETETGELMFREAPDYENPSDVESAEPRSGAADNEYIVVVEVRSGEGERERKGERAIRVRVTDEEEPPEITGAGVFEVVENRTRVGRLEAVDSDEGDEITEYGIAGGADGGLFAVEAETGELSFREAPDYEAPGDVESAEPQSGAGDNEYIVVVEVRSGEGERERKGRRAIRVRVSDEEEPPEITSLGPFEVVENRTRVGQLEAVDPDEGDEIRGYGIAGGADAALFAVEAETGELLFREAPDYEDPSDVESAEPASGAADNEYIVVVEVRSGEGERERKGSRAIRVRVSDEEEPPGAPGAPVVTAEGSGSLKVSWTEPENRGPEIVDYEVRYREGGEEGYSDGGHQGTGLMVRLSGLKEGTAYEVQVRAVNQEGMSEWSEPGEGRTDMQEPDPDDPSDFTGEELEGRRLRLRLEGEEGTAGSLELRFGEGNRFEQIESGGEQTATRSERASRSGTYAYQRTGPLMGTVRLDYDDGASCELRLSFTESGVGAFAYDCGGGDPAEGSFRLMTGSLFVPVILSSAGRNQSFFTSELTLTNRGDEEAKLDYLYTAHIGGGSGSTSEVLAPGRQKIETDALAYLIGLGVPIPETGNRIGTLRVDVPLGSEVEAVVRTTTVVPVGRAGLAYLGVAEEEGFEEAVYLCGLRQNAQDRSNVAFQNMGAPEEGAITVRTTVYSGAVSDTSPQVLEDVKLEPGGFHQYSGLLGRLESVEGNRQGYVKVERVEGRAPFYAYGVINDQANSDGSFVFPVRASSLEGRTGQTLPVIVETNEFRSELTVTNFSEDPRTLDFQFVAEGIETDDKTAAFSMTLEAGRQEIIADVVDELRRQRVAGLGSGSRALAGAVFATAAEGDMSGIVIGARTGSQGGGGSYSVFYNAVPFGSASIESAWIYGLQQNEENRSNLALVNTGEVDGSPSVFHLEIYDGETGMLAKTVVTKPILARRWHQINGILGSYAPETRQGYIRIEKVSGENPFLAYGVVNDGGAPGERSGDGAYLPARE